MEPRPAAFLTASSMVSALGTDVATSCAAARAGILRAQPVEGIRFISSSDGEPAPVVAHSVPVIATGFVGQARLARLLGRAFADLMAQLGDDATRSVVGLYLALPPLSRIESGKRLADADADAAAEPSPTDEDGTGFDAEARSLLSTVLAAHPVLERAKLRWCSRLGHAGGARCVEAAVTDLARGHVEIAIVAAADSLLDTETIEWLYATRRLKLADMPVGVQPGEAAVALALKPTPPDERPLTLLRPSTLQHEDKALLTGAVSSGDGIGTALASIAAFARWQQPQERAWLVSDLNGEIYRATEWAHALVRLRAQCPALDGVEVWMPAESFGDTGAASALVAVCVAAKAIERGYAPAHAAIVASSSEGHARGAIFVGPG